MLFADSRSGEGEITLVRFPGLYRGRGFNTPRRGDRSGCVLNQATRTTVGNVRYARTVGNRVFFVSPADPTGGNSDGSDELFVVDQAGDVVQLTDLRQGGIRDLALSGDGTIAAFISDGTLTVPDPPGENLFLLKTSSGEVVAVPLQPEGAPSIDGSGRYVAVASKSDPLGLNTDGNGEIFLVDTEAPVGEKLTQITQTTGRGSRAPSLNDDGSVLAFRSAANLTGQNPDVDLAIFVYRRSDAQTVQVALEERSPGEIPEDPIPISGDATRLVFVSRENLTGQNPAGGNALYVADLAEATLRQVFLTGRGLALSDISKDGELAAIASSADPKELNRDRNTEIFLIDLDGGPVVQLTRSVDAVNLQADLSPEALVISVLSNADYLGLNRDGNFEAFLFRCQRP